MKLKVYSYACKPHQSKGNCSWIWKVCYYFHRLLKLNIFSKNNWQHFLSPLSGTKIKFTMTPSSTQTFGVHWKTMLAMPPCRRVHGDGGVEMGVQTPPTPPPPPPPLRFVCFDSFCSSVCQIGWSCTRIPIPRSWKVDKTCFWGRNEKSCSTPCPPPPPPVTFSGLTKSCIHPWLLAQIFSHLYEELQFLLELHFKYWIPFSHFVSWEPEGRYCRSKMFCWEPEGRYCHWLCTAITPFWFSTEHLWAAIMPFWLSTDDKNLFFYYLSNTQNTFFRHFVLINAFKLYQFTAQNNGLATLQCCTPVKCYGVYRVWALHKIWITTSCTLLIQQYLAAIYSTNCSATLNYGLW